MMKASKRHYFLILLLLVLGLDYLCFEILFWQIPNESAWAGQPHYNFVWRLRQLKARERNGRTSLAAQDESAREYRVLIVGSSVALYSVLPDKLQRAIQSQLDEAWQQAGGGYAPAQKDKESKVLKEPPPRVRVDLLSHHGMTPLHLRAYQHEILQLKPDLLILPINPVDLRLENPVVNDQMQALQAPVGSSDLFRARADQAQYLLSESVFQMAVPGRTLFLYGHWLRTEDRIRLGWSGVSSGVRYLPVLADVLDQWRLNHTARGRHYHYYNGQPVMGLSHKGWAAQYFAFEVQSPVVMQDWWLQLHPEASATGRTTMQVWLCDPAAVNKQKFLRHHFTGSESSFAMPASCNSEKVHLQAGWQRVPLQKLLATPTKPGQYLIAEVQDRFYDSAVADERSVRFARNFGVAAIRQRTAEMRPLRREDYLYKNFNNLEYDDSFQKRILNFNRAGMQYLHALQLAKQAWAGRDFDRGLPVAQAYLQSNAAFARAGLDRMVINTPENPISLAWYGSSSWYRQYLQFLAEGAGGRSNLIDLHATSPRQEFYDYHHLSYFGAERFGSMVAPQIVERMLASSGR